MALANATYCCQVKPEKAAWTWSHLPSATRFVHPEYELILTPSQFAGPEAAVVVEAERADREGALAHAAVHQHPGHLLRPGNQLRTRE